MIRTENLSRQFQSGREVIHALRDINIQINPGTLTILRGRSGSGKTTLINLLGALDKPTEGKIFFMDQDITKLSEVKKDLLRKNNMGFIFQSIALMPLMTAYENVEFGLRVAGYDKEKRKKRAEACLTMVGLQNRMHHRPQELSGGEQQRVAIARAIAHKPKVVFADEPTAELDTNMGLQVVKVLKDLVEEEGLTVVMSTHDPSMIDIADCVYTLEDGVIVDIAE
ncbi:MAG: ABC transporter ATP-binding protein [Caldicoprobacterales bacterium]|jgi:putative ABC transport system ATP-binding protein|nr:ABC transporter ATP-binding protein [Clostridiales bacterium]NLX70412.1 ABC transporter ATP-binding protein [Clostridiales bacterium]